MDCKKYEDKIEDLKHLLEDFKKNINSVTYEQIQEMRCLLCKNNLEIFSREIIAFFTELTEKFPYNHLYWFGLAAATEKIGLYSFAEDYYRKAQKLFPNNPFYNERLVVMCINNNRINEAVEYRNFALSSGSKKKDYLTEIIAQALLAKNEFALAKNWFLSLEQKNKQNFEMLGNCEEGIKNYNEAITYYKQALESKNSDTIKEKIANCYFNTQRYNEALVLFKEIPCDDNHYINYINISACLSNLGKCEEAIEYFEKILSIEPNNITTIFNYAKTSKKINDFDRMIALIKKCIKLEPNNFIYYNYLFEYFNEAEKYDDAIDICMNALKIDLNNVKTLRNLSIIFYRVKKENKALPYLEHLQQISKLSAFDYFLLAECYKVVENIPKAIINYEEAIKLDSNNYNYLERFGEFYIDCGEVEKAIFYYEEANKFSFKDYKFLIRYADALFKTKDYLKAHTVYQEAIDIKALDISKKTHAYILYKLGLCSFRINDYESSKNYFFEAVKMNPLTESKLYLMMAYNKLDANKGMIDLMLKEEKLFDDDFSKFLLAYYSSKNGEFGKAIEIVDKFIEKYKDLEKDYRELFIHIKGIIYFQSDLLEKAIECFAQINSNDLILDESKRLLGICNLRMGSPSQSIDELTKACRKSNENAFNHFNLGIAYLYNNQSDKALDSFGKAFMCENNIDCVENYYLFTTLNNFSNDEKMLAAKLFYFMLDMVADIKRLLKYKKQGKGVYHYTKIEILKALLEQNAKLRMNNSAYMNDPSEGRVFSTLMTKKSQGNIARLADKINNPRENIAHSNNFLFSFSEANDLLSMWVQYSKDASGCSLKLPDNFFDNYDNTYRDMIFQNERIIKKSKSELKYKSSLKIITNSVGDQLNAIASTDNSVAETKQFVVDYLDGVVEGNEELKDYLDFAFDIFTFGFEQKNNEKYCLYNVCYIDGKSKNLKSTNIKPDVFNLIIHHVRFIEKFINELIESEMPIDKKAVVYNLLNEILDQIRFLFKSSDYAPEKEIRLVKTKYLYASEVKQQNKGKVFDNLYIEINKPIFFDEVILGAKADNPLQIAPALIKSGKVKKVTQSSIKYQ